MMKHKRMLMILGVVSVMLTLVVAGLVLAAQEVVDTFDTSDIDLENAITGTVVSDFYQDAGILGGEHSICLTKTGGTRAVEASIDEFNTNQFAFAAQSNTDGNACITWDGQDASPAVLDRDGLGGYDLTDGNTNDGFQLSVPFTDGDFDLTLRVYSNTQQSNSPAIELRPGAGSLVDQTFFIPFADFVAVSGGGVDFADVGAIQLFVVPLEDAVDLEVDLLETTAATDWGDLPDALFTTSGANGPNHIVTGPYLGSVIDREANGFPTSNALGDNNNNFDDEEGVVRDMNDKWQDGNSVDLLVTVNGCTGTCYLNGWIDWNDNSSWDGGEQVLTDYSISDGDNQTVSISVPTGSAADDGTTNTLYGRFRICSTTSACNTTQGSADDGEVEDYEWSFGPNAVTLSAIDAGPALASLPALALVVAAVVGGAGLFIWRRRR